MNFYGGKSTNNGSDLYLGGNNEILICARCHIRHSVNGNMTALTVKLKKK